LNASRKALRICDPTSVIMPQSAFCKFTTLGYEYHQKVEKNTEEAVVLISLDYKTTKSQFWAHCTWNKVCVRERDRKRDYSL